MGGRDKKLLTAARLYFSDPPKYGRDCLDCRRNNYDETTGKVKMSRVSGYTLPMLRIGSPPCHECGKTVGLEPRDRVWANATEPGPRAYRAFRFWLECRAVGEWPRDPIVRRFASACAMVEEAVRNGRSAGVLEVLGLVRGRT